MVGFFITENLEANMTDKSKWFVFKKNDQVFGCFRIKPFSDPEFGEAYKMLLYQKKYF